MSKGFNYSKWDNIELSDDESDLHPNIDKDSWFRMKHRTRLEREEKEDREVQAWNQKTAQDSTRLNIINARIKAVEAGEGDAGEDAEFEDVEALKVEKKELESQIAERNQKIAEINERRSWNIDNICKVKEEKTVVNDPTIRSLSADVSLVDPARLPTAQNSDKPDSSSSSSVFSKSAATASSSSSAAKPTASSSASATKPAAGPVEKGAEPAAGLQRERLAVISYNDYVTKHEKLLEEYSEIADMEATKNFVFKHCDVLLHEHAQSYMLLSSLEDEMNGKKKRMLLVCRQSQILSHIHDLGTSMKRDPRDVILPFFKRIEEKEHYEGFTSAVNDFIKRIQKRAVEKRKEMDLERARELREEHLASGEKGPAGPGGLDPFEVLESLPVELRDAFESQDLEQLQAVLAHMKPQDAKHWMKQCVDSGLWVPQDKSIFENEGEMDAADSDGEAEEDGPRVEELDA
jgi:cell division cycle protein 37